MDARRRSTMRGFSLLEALVSVAILSGTVLALTSAMLGSTHDTSTLVSRQTLTDVATDVLTDLRVAAAYQPEVMDALYRHPSGPFSVTRAMPDGGTTTIGVSESLTPLASGPGYEVSVVTTDPAGHSETLQETVIQQAVAPGSTVTQAPATPSSGDSAVSGGGALGGGPDNPVPPSAPRPMPSIPGCIEAGACWPHGRPQPPGIGREP